MATPEQRGGYVERFIAGLSSMFFLNDFVFQKPSYHTHGHKREVTDLMLVLGQECIFVSVKGTDGEEKAPERFRLWAQKKSGQASTNARVAGQRAARVDVSGVNLWGEERTFPAASLTPICGLALVECTQEIFAPIPLPNVPGPDGTGSCPVHTLSINDFHNVVMLLGSIWDVFNYFKRRAAVSHLLPGLNMERPLVCYYTLKSREDFSGFRAEDATELAELHQLFILDKLPEFGERDRLAGYINAVVHQLHTRHRDFEEYAPPEFRSLIEPANRRQAYLGMAARLNALPMSNKAWLGRQIESCVEQAQRVRRYQCFLYKQLLGEIVFVFAVFVGWSRREKLRGLVKLLPAAQHSTGMIEALGVAYDGEDESMGFDLIWRRGPIEDVEAAAALATEAFPGELETQCPTPFGDPRPYAPKGVSPQGSGQSAEGRRE
jgi:hypothetical protein